MSKIYGYSRYCPPLHPGQSEENLIQTLADAGAEEIVTELVDTTRAATPQLDLLLASAGPGSAIICPSIHSLCSSAKQLRSILAIVKHKQMCLFIPDRLLVDFRTGEGDAMSQAFVHALNLIAELDHTVNSQYIREGLQKARKEGRSIGRPRVEVDDIPLIFFEHLPLYDAGTLNISKFARACHLSRPTIYKYLRMVNRR